MLAALFDLFIELLRWTFPVFTLDEEASENFTFDDEAADDDADADFVVDLVFDEAWDELALDELSTLVDVFCSSDEAWTEEDVAIFASTEEDEEDVAIVVESIVVSETLFRSDN